MSSNSKPSTNLAQTPNGIDSADNAMALDNSPLGESGDKDEHRMQDGNKDVEMKVTESRGEEDEEDKEDKEDEEDALPDHHQNDMHGDSNEESNDSNPQLNHNQYPVPTKQRIKLRGAAFKQGLSGLPEVNMTMLIDYLLMSISPL